MDLYLEFRKMIRPLIIPDNDGRSTTQEKQTQQGQPADERGVRRDEKDEVIRSIATCETW